MLMLLFYLFGLRAKQCELFFFGGAGGWEVGALEARVKATWDK